MSAPIARVGGRLILLDPDGRVLLINETIDDGSTHWLTPGGGLEPGETPAQAARREGLEEIGVAVEVPDDAPAVLITRRRWSWAGVVYDQVDHFFVARVDAEPAIEPQGLTPMEIQTLIGYRWWSRAELRATAEVIVPAELAEVLAGLAGPAS
jgi:8-oxo-dGTP pyrophosphatase MutT (NUDIX family)